MEDERNGAGSRSNEKMRELWRLAREAYKRQDWDTAERHYTQAIEAAPENAKMYVYRGGVRSAKAQSIEDREQYLQALAAIVSDYQKAYELAPEDEEVGASLLESEICSGRVTDAANHALEIWPDIRNPIWKGICGWLGAVACALDGRAEEDWKMLRETLGKAHSAVALVSWNTGDLEKYLFEYAKHDVPEDRLEKARALHAEALTPLQQKQEAAAVAEGALNQEVEKSGTQGGTPIVEMPVFTGDACDRILNTPIRDLALMSPEIDQRFDRNLPITIPKHLEELGFATGDLLTPENSMGFPGALSPDLREKLENLPSPVSQREVTTKCYSSAGLAIPDRESFRLEPIRDEFERGISGIGGGGYRSASVSGTEVVANLIVGAAKIGIVLAGLFFLIRWLCF